MRSAHYPARSIRCCQQLTISFLAIQSHWSKGGINWLVKAIRPGPGRRSSGRSWSQVVAMARLVVDRGDHTRGAGAERILRGSMSDSTRNHRLDIFRRSIRFARDLIQWSVVCTEESTRCAMGSNTGRVARCIQIAWCGSRKRSCCCKAKCQGHVLRGGRHDQYARKAEDGQPSKCNG